MILGVPDQIFATTAHYAFLVAVAVAAVAVTATVSAAIIQRHRP